MENQCKKPKWLSGEALQIAVKRGETKSKGEKERYKHLNTEFQIIARREKKAFLSDQCKEIEENNRMGRTRDLLKRIRYQGKFHSTLEIIKDRIDKELQQKWKRLRRGGENTQKDCTKMFLMTWTSMMVWSLT